VAGPDGENHTYLFHDGDLIVDMEVFRTVPCTDPATEVWVDRVCSNVLIAVEADRRYFFQETGKPVLSCQVDSQHYATATIFLTCDTGVGAELLPEEDGNIRWNGAIMTAYDGPLPCSAKRAGE